MVSTAAAGATFLPENRFNKMLKLRRCKYVYMYIYLYIKYSRDRLLKYCFQLYAAACSRDGLESKRIA